MSSNGSAQDFLIEIIKPSHYDDDGYLIQWALAFVPSNSLACVYGLVQDVQKRRLLGDGVNLLVNAHDESHTVLPVDKIIRRIQANGGRGLVMLAGVQSNQFPRAADLAAKFRAAGIQVAIGGFHVSGCLAMLPELPADIRAIQEIGVSIYAGEAEGRMDVLLRDAVNGELKPVYNYMLDLPELQGQVTPSLPRAVAKRYLFASPFDVGRGCPFMCSFCTIINVQGRKSRYRDAEDVERVVRDYLAQGIRRFFITDDNMARNKNWEAIFDRLIHLREVEGINAKFVIQVDTMCHKIPNFIEKAARAGCHRVFIGLENINPENLEAANKRQNKITEYRQMLQAWRSRGVVTYAGYILGLPADTPASIERDIALIQKELPVDILEFMVLTPLPGSADHKALYEKGVWMDPDMNKYDLEHVTTTHPKMSVDEWRDVYHRAWGLYYSPEHIKTLLLRAEVCGGGAKRMAKGILQFYGSYRFEKVHPLQCGIFRRKVRKTRRPGFKVENPLVFHARRICEALYTYSSLLFYFLWIDRLRRQVEREVRAAGYTDVSLAPVADTDDESLELYQVTEAAKAAVAKARHKAAKHETLAKVELPVLKRIA